MKKWYYTAIETKWLFNWTSITIQAHLEKNEGHFEENTVIENWSKRPEISSGWAHSVGWCFAYSLPQCLVHVWLSCSEILAFKEEILIPCSRRLPNTAKWSVPTTQDACSSLSWLTHHPPILTHEQVCLHPERQCHRNTASGKYDRSHLWIFLQAMPSWTKCLQQRLVHAPRSERHEL